MVSLHLLLRSLFLETLVVQEHLLTMLLLLRPQLQMIVIIILLLILITFNLSLIQYLAMLHLLNLLQINMLLCLISLAITSKKKNNREGFYSFSVLLSFICSELLFFSFLSSFSLSAALQASANNFPAVPR